MELRPRPPFRLDLTAWALRRQPHNAIDRWNGRTWRRVLAIGDGRALPVGHDRIGSKAPWS